MLSHDFCKMLSHDYYSIANTKGGVGIRYHYKQNILKILPANKRINNCSVENVKYFT